MIVLHQQDPGALYQRIAFNASQSEQYPGDQNSTFSIAYAR